MRHDTIEAGVIAGIGYRAAGAVGAPALVFLHGISGGARWFDPQLAAFADTHRVVALDAAGFGLSTMAPAGSMAGHAAALAGFLDAARLGPAVLVGHSMGGMVVQEYLAQGGAARAIVLVGTSAVFGSRDPAWQEAFIAGRLGLLDRGGTMADVAAAMQPGDGTPAQIGPDPDLVGIGLARSVTAAVGADAYRLAVRSLIGFDRRAALGQIGVPALLIAGEVDINAPPKGMQKMAESISGARYVCLPRCGHLQNLEQPAQFNAALRAFLTTLDGTA